MGRFTGVLGIATILGLAYLFPPVANPFDSRPFFGESASISSGLLFCASNRESGYSKNWATARKGSSTFLCRLVVRVRELGKDHSSLGFDLCLPSLAYHHFHRCVF